MIFLLKYSIASLLASSTTEVSISYKKNINVSYGIQDYFILCKKVFRTVLNRYQMRNCQSALPNGELSAIVTLNKLKRRNCFN